jgi:sacsin
MEFHLKTETGENDVLTLFLMSLWPRDHSVLNELLQNADDAGATEIHFVLDSRDHGTNRIFNQKWTQLQGPGLCVFNDAW